MAVTVRVTRDRERVRDSVTMVTGHAHGHGILPEQHILQENG
jgi:hypothetical protein